MGIRDYILSKVLEYLNEDTKDLIQKRDWLREEIKALEWIIGEREV